MSDVFISYSSANRAEAFIVARFLQDEGFSVWWDQDLTPHRPWDDAIEQALVRARAVVVLWTPHSVRSDHVRAEAHFAKEHGKLIPAMLHPCDIPMSFRLHQFANLVGWQQQPVPDWQRLVTWIRQKLEVVSEPTPEPATDEIAFTECKWTGWVPEGSAISCEFTYFSRETVSRLRVDVRVDPGSVVGGMQMRSTTIVHFHFEKQIAPTNLDSILLRSRDASLPAEKLLVRAGAGGDGSKFFGFFNQADSNAAYRALASGRDLELSGYFREEEVLRLPLPGSVGLTDLVRQRLSSAPQKKKRSLFGF